VGYSSVGRGDGPPVAGSQPPGFSGGDENANTLLHCPRVQMGEPTPGKCVPHPQMACESSLVALWRPYGLGAREHPTR